MHRIVADDQTIINTQGIRYAEKVDNVGSTYEHYSLNVSYRGTVLQHRYPDKASRDAQYDRLREIITRSK